MQYSALWEISYCISLIRIKNDWTHSLNKSEFLHSTVQIWTINSTTPHVIGLKYDTSENVHIACIIICLISLVSRVENLDTRNEHGLEKKGRKHGSEKEYVHKVIKNHKSLTKKLLYTVHIRDIICEVNRNITMINHTTTTQKGRWNTHPTGDRLNRWGYDITAENIKEKCV